MTTPEIFEVTVVGLFGLLIGSFLNAVIHRVPRKQSIVSPGSQCPSCGYALRWYDNIPILSYVLLGGRCRKCRKPISIRYPIVEMITAVVFVAHYFVFGWTPLLVVRLLFAASLVALFAIDLEHHLLPDVITLPGIAVGLVASAFLPPGLMDALIGMLIGGGVLWLIGEAYFRYSGEEGMGGGDVKMLAMIGAFLGWKLVLVTLVLSSVAGSVLGLAIIAIKRGSMKYALPFGTFLALGALAASLVGDQIVTWYAGTARMTETGWLLLGLNAIVAFVLGALGYAVVKILTAARSLATRKPEGSETAFMAAAMEEAVQRLRAQELAMQERAEASEHLSEEIIASMSSGLLVVSEDRHVRTLNPAGRSLLGLTGQPSSTAMDDVLQTAAPLAAAVDECLETKRPVLRRTLQTQLRGGATVHLGVTVSPLRDPQGQELGAICLFTDLSDVVDLEDQLRLKDSLARLGELTAGIAHEFRNGLATIHGYSRLLDPDKVPAEYGPYIKGLRNETDALRQVVTNFLNFAKPTELVLASVSLQPLVDRAADECRTDATARGGAVEIRGEFGTVQGDEVLLRQAFSNLCRNALEACADAGVAPHIRIEGTVDHGQGAQHVVVSDNGPGVDPNIIARMFRPFFTTKSRGTGLGLALVQKIIVTHNGRVSVANGEHGGARFTVTLPLEPSPPLAAL